MSPQGQLTLYYEPHCSYNKEFLGKENADIVITPVIKQLLPNFTLVYGQEDAVQLAKQLDAKYECFQNLPFTTWWRHLCLYIIMLETRA